MTKNTLTDLNDHLFAQMERLGDENLKGDKLKDETARAKAMCNVAENIINNGKLVLEAQKEFSPGNPKGPKMLGVDSGSDTGKQGGGK